MKYCRLNEAGVQQAYGRYSRLSEEGDETIVVYRGSNLGAGGVPELNIVLPFPGILLDVDDQPYDIKQGFSIPELTADFFVGFDESTRIIPVAKIKRMPSGSHRKHLFVTFDATKVEFVLIGRKCNQDTNQTTRDDLRSLAEYSRMGGPDQKSDYFWDYHLLSFRSDYNVVADNQHFLSDAKYATTAEQLERRQQLLNSFLKEKFGTPDTLSSMILDADGKLVEDDTSILRQASSKLIISQPQNSVFATTNRTQVEKVLEQSKPIPARAPEQINQWYFLDDLHHYETWVIDREGRFLEPNMTPKHKIKQFYARAETSLDQIWNCIPDNCVVVRYARNGISEPAEYTLLYKPEDISSLQIDAITVLEQQMLRETHEIVVKRKLFERFALRGAEMTWTKQLRND